AGPSRVAAGPGYPGGLRRRGRTGTTDTRSRAFGRRPAARRTATAAAARPEPAAGTATKPSTAAATAGVGVVPAGQATGDRRHRHPTKRRQRVRAVAGVGGGTLPVAAGRLVPLRGRPPERAADRAGRRTRTQLADRAQGPG